MLLWVIWGVSGSIRSRSFISMKSEEGMLTAAPLSYKTALDRSKTVTRYPRRSNTRAARQPTMEPPIIAISFINCQNIATQEYPTYQCGDDQGDILVTGRLFIVFLMFMARKSSWTILTSEEQRKLSRIIGDAAIAVPVDTGDDLTVNKSTFCCDTYTRSV